MGETWDGEGVELMSRGVWRTCQIFCRYMGNERRQFLFFFSSHKLAFLEHVQFSLSKRGNIVLERAEVLLERTAMQSSVIYVSEVHNIHLSEIHNIHLSEIQS